jgi:serine/threonine protein kinase
MFSLSICASALRPLILEAVSKKSHDSVGPIVQWLIERYSDPSGKLPAALLKATDRAWRAVEVGLVGPTLLDRLIDRGEDRGFRLRVQQFVEAIPLEDRGIDKKQVLVDLSRARRAGAIPGAGPPAETLANEAARFFRYSPNELIEAEFREVAAIGPGLRRAGYVALAQFVELRPSADVPLIVLAVRFFFSRELAANPSLLGDLTYARVSEISDTLRTGLDGLADAIDGHGDALADALDLLAGIRADVFDLKAEQQRQAGDLRAIYEDVRQVGNKLDRLHERDLRAADGFSIRSEDERKLIQRVVAEYRLMTEENRRKSPALLDAIGKLEHAAGDFDAAAKDFSRAAEIVQDPEAKATAHIQAFRAEVESKQWAEALSHFLQAVEAGGPVYRLFPTDKYIPSRILGAGGFGTVFLCQDRFLKKEVVVKALTTDDLARDIDSVFDEARVLEELSHPSLIRLRDCGCAENDPRRPYIVMEYFAAGTLDDYVHANGALSPQAARSVGRGIAEGLEAAHRKKILHRDVKPGNVLLRRDESASDPAQGWEVKLIDFGLAVRIRSQSTVGGTRGQSILGRSIAGTYKFAAPEQIGELEGVSVSPRSDVYGLGTSLCFALFKTARPSRRQWRQIEDEPLAELLDECLSDHPNDRPELAEVLVRLALDPVVSVGFERTTPAPEPVERPIAEEVPEPDRGPASESSQTPDPPTNPQPASTEAAPTIEARPPRPVYPFSYDGSRPDGLAPYYGAGLDGQFRGIGAQLLRAGLVPATPVKPATSGKPSAVTTVQFPRRPSNSLPPPTLGKKIRKWFLGG